MDTRSRHRFTWLLAVALAGACTLDDPGAFARQGLRAVARLIEVTAGAPAPSPGPAPTITTGVRG